MKYWNVIDYEVSILVNFPAFREDGMKIMVIVILDTRSEDISNSEIQISPFAVFRVIYSRLRDELCLWRFKVLKQRQGRKGNAMRDD